MYIIALFDEFRASKNKTNKQNKQTFPPHGLWKQSFSTLKPMVIKNHRDSKMLDRWDFQICRVHSCKLKNKYVISFTTRQVDTGALHPETHLWTAGMYVCTVNIL